MQIFASNTSPYLSAYALDDARLRKMMIETAQLLSAAVHNLQAKGMLIVPENMMLYKVVPQGKALSTWASEPNEFAWLCVHGLALTAELQMIRGLSVDKFVPTKEVLSNCRSLSKQLGGDWNKATGFVNATEQKRDGVNFKHIADTNLAYRMYLNARWAIQANDPRLHLRPKWTNANLPSWHYTLLGTNPAPVEIAA